MRDIKFRGKRVDNGEWVYGAFVPDALEQTHSDMVSWGFIRRYNGSKSEMIEVDRKTVGEYTGLKDKNGREIYEGDILESRASENREDWKKWICIYEDGSYCFEADTGVHKRKIVQNLLCKDEIELYGLVVIGNIYENPELLNKIG
jgi:uncharacterized phage protein (TIGR01671 family)